MCNNFSGIGVFESSILDVLNNILNHELDINDNVSLALLEPEVLRGKAKDIKKKISTYRTCLSFLNNTVAQNALQMLSEKLSVKVSSWTFAVLMAR